MIAAHTHAIRAIQTGAGHAAGYFPFVGWQQFARNRVGHAVNAYLYRTVTRLINHDDMIPKRCNIVRRAKVAVPSSIKYITQSRRGRITDVKHADPTRLVRTQYEVTASDHSVDPIDSWPVRYSLFHHRFRRILDIDRIEIARSKK